jgi:hypothetical protein
MSITITVIRPKNRYTGHEKLYIKEAFPSDPTSTVGALKKKPVVILIVFKATITATHIFRVIILPTSPYSQINTNRVIGSRVRPKSDMSYQNFTDGHS